MSEFKEFMAEAAPNLLKLERSRFPDIDSYCQELMHRYGRSVWVYFLADVGETIEPRDRVLGTDPGLPATKAFVKGGLVGLRLVKEFAPKDVEERMLKVQVAQDPECEDWLDRIHNVALTAIDSAERGVNLVPQMEPLVEEWAAEAVRDVTVQPYFRRGFGLMMYMMHEAYEQKATDDLWQADLDGVNWDEEYRNFFGTDE